MATDVPESSVPTSNGIDYNVHGYEMAPHDRCIYAFLSADGRRVKIGLVNRATSLEERLRTVATKCQESGLRRVAYVTVHAIDGHEVEDVEAAIRLWLTRTRAFSHAGRVDWLYVPDGHHDWDQLLHDALAAVNAWSGTPRPEG
jgi:hypothetical protein